MKPLSIRLVLTTGAALVIAACGGGNAGSGSAANGSQTLSAVSEMQIASGTITGFGSVIVDGVRYDDSGASVRIDDDTASPRNGSLSSLKLGMRVEMEADRSNRASAVRIAPEVVGKVTAVGADGFTLAGQTVRVSTTASATAPVTVFEGVSGVDAIALGDWLEVHGSRDSAGVVLASRVELKDPSALTAIRVAGTISGYEPVTRSFTIGGLLVKLDAGARVMPTGVLLADGLRVSVWTTKPIEGSLLTAQSVSVRRSGLANNDLAKLGGVVSALDPATKTFSIDGVVVDASAAAFTRGTLADLVNGRRVRVSGNVESGKVIATEIAFMKDPSDAKVELYGAITDFVSAADFKVRGVPVNASGSAIEFRNGGAENLANGVMVRLEGNVEGSVVLPTELSFVLASDAQARWLAGPVSSISANGFNLAGMSVRLAANTLIRKSDGTTASLADLRNGVKVEVKGSVVDGVFTATEVSIGRSDLKPVRSLEGSASSIDLGRGELRINGTLVKLGPGTRIEGDRNALIRGARIEVSGELVNGSILAGKLEIKAPELGDVARIRGMVTDYVSNSDFRVAGQRVNGTNASVSGDSGSSAVIANGSFLEVSGSMVSGVLTASRIEVK